MSFSTDLKQELAHVEPQCTHCNVAALSALIRTNGVLLFKGTGKFSLEISTEAALVARFIVQSLHEIYGLQTTLTTRTNVLHKTPNWLIGVPSQKKLGSSLVELGILKEDGTLERGIAPKLIAKNCCSAAYMRGIFLGGGFVSDPSGNFHLEIKIESQTLAQDLVAMLSKKGPNGDPIPLKIIERRNSYLLYLKSGENIANLIGFMQATNAYLYFQNVRVKKSMRNKVNRQVNAEMANSNKAGAAAEKQIATIKHVLKYYSFHNLPNGLQEYVLLRVSNPNASMKELGELANPPVSKGAIYHRVKRFEEMEAGLPKKRFTD